MAVTTRRKPASGDLELHNALAEARTEIGELRQALRAVAGLAFGIGVHRAPIGTGESITTIRGVCQLYGVSGHTATIEKLFSP